MVEAPKAEGGTWVTRCKAALARVKQSTGVEHFNHRVLLELATLADAVYPDEAEPQRNGAVDFLQCPQRYVTVCLASLT